MKDNKISDVGQENLRYKSELEIMKAGIKEKDIEIY